MSGPNQGCWTSIFSPSKDLTHQITHNFLCFIWWSVGFFIFYFPLSCWNFLSTCRNDSTVDLALRKPKISFIREMKMTPLGRRKSLIKFCRGARTRLEMCSQRIRQQYPATFLTLFPPGVHSLAARGVQTSRRCLSRVSPPAALSLDTSWQIKILRKVP